MASQLNQLPIVRLISCAAAWKPARRWTTLAMIVAILMFAGDVYARRIKPPQVVHSPFFVPDDGPASLPLQQTPPAGVLAAPVNDTCVGALPILLNRVTKGTTVGANDDYQTPDTTACYAGIGQTPTTAPGRDVVYSFVAPQAGKYSFRIVQQGPYDPIRMQDEVLYVVDGSAGCPAAGAVDCLSGANRSQSRSLRSSTGSSNNQSEEVNCLLMTQGQRVYVFFDDGAAGNAGGDMSLEAIECTSEVEPNGTPATANPFVCGISGSSDAAPVAHCYLGTRAGQMCTRSTFLDQSFPSSNMRCSISDTLCVVNVFDGTSDCGAGEGVCQQHTDLDCDPRCDVGPNAGKSCTTQAFCNPVSDQGAVCAGTCQVESTCVTTATGADTGVACTPVCVGGFSPGRYCSSLSGCSGGGVCATTPLIPIPGATCVSGQTCGRQFNEGDTDFFSLGTVVAGSKVFAGVDAKFANDYDWRMRITTDTKTLQFDDDDGTSRNGSNAPEIAGAVADGTATYIKISRTGPRTSEPYELYAIVRPPLATAQLEDESGPLGNDIYYGWPGDVVNANYVTGGGYVRGTFGFNEDSDCFKFLVNEGDLMDWFGDGNPGRIAGATGITNIAEPIIYDAEPAGISHFVFGANPRRNTLSNVASAGLSGLTPAVTSSHFQWRASYTGMLMVCFYDASQLLGQGTHNYPSPWAGSLSVNCGPLQPAGRAPRPRTFR